MKNYQRLSPSERDKLSVWKAEGISNKECARRLVRNVSTIGKEITLLFFYIPKLHQKREMFEQCDIWGSKISGLFKTVEKID